MPRTLGPTWLAAESERIGAVDYNSVFTLQKKNLPRTISVSGSHQSLEILCTTHP